jgi:hypothetical protein
MLEELAKNIVRPKRRMTIIEKNSLEVIYQHFLKNYDNSSFNIFSHNLKLYNEAGIDCGDYQRWYRYYKQKLEGKL